MKKHDFTNKALRWGWNHLLSNRKSETEWDSMFIGIGIKDGDEILLTTTDGTSTFAASDVRYDGNPPDLLRCRLTFLRSDTEEAK